MKLDKAHRNSLLVIIIVTLIAVALFSYYLIPSNSFSKTKVYFEPLANFSMQAPASFNIQREKLAEEEAIIKVVAPNDFSSANPGLINILMFKQVEGVTLEQRAAAFLSIPSERLISFDYQTPAYSYLSQNGQELSYYYFFENAGYVIVYKFNKSYFDKSNPLILVDNSLYANTVIRTLNSINFK